MSAADESELEELEEVLETVEEDDDESEDAVPPTILLESRHCRAVMKSEAGTRDNKRVCGNESATCRRKGHAEQRLKGLQADVGVYDTCPHKDGLDGYLLSYQGVAQVQGKSTQTFRDIAALSQSSPSGDSAISFFGSPTSAVQPKSVSKDDNNLVMMMKAMQEEQANAMRQLLTYQQEQAAIQAKEIAKLQSELLSMKVKDDPAVKSTKKQVTLQVPPSSSTYMQSSTLGQVDSDDDDEEAPNEYIHGAGDGKHAWYAVVAGREVGLFNSWAYTESVVQGYPNAIYCGFKRKAQAIRWWKQERAQLAALDFQKGAAIGPAILPRTSDSFGTTTPTGILLHDPSSEKNTWDTDSSKGRKIHGVHIDVESEVLNLLCPNGVSVEVQTQLAESALDVISLPGKQGVSVNSNSIDVLAQSVSEALEYTRHQGRQEFWRDTQWQSPTRIGISIIRDRSSLFEKYRTLRAVKEKVMKAMKGKFRAILSKAGWDTTSILSWLNTGFLPRFIARTYDWYLLLVQRAQEIACVQPWSHVERFLTYHKEEFTQIRMISTSRLSMLANNYVYLRDAQDDNFAGVEYHESVITDLMTLVEKMQGDKQPKKGCNHCGSTKHKGHKKKCPFKDVTSAAAKELVDEATELAEDESISFADAAKRVIADN